jgi:hypothetical protein
MKSHVFILALFFVLTSCLNQDGPRSGALKSKSASKINAGQKSGEQGAGPQDTGIGNTDNTSDNIQQVELRHFINPFDGSYTPKLTLPKNYQGSFYIAGLNLTSLNEKFLYVRFYFGKERAALTLPATLGRADGLTIYSDLQVLVLNFDALPLSRLQLFYDLYDGASDSDTNPTQDPRSRQLYCRGLSAIDDTTPAKQYAFAKVLDNGAYNNITGLPRIPSEPNVQIATGATLASEKATYGLKRCLSDSNDALNATIATIDGVNDLFRGPYRFLNYSQWQITPDKLFRTITGVDQTTARQSLLFPRKGKLQLRSGVEYLDSSGNVSTLSSAGETAFMDGCNIRAASYNASLNEHIGSCNVTATVELLSRDSSGGEVILASSRELKLQVVRASQENFRGKEVLFGSSNRCASSNQCGSDECCYNSRCWSKDIVNSCGDELEVVGNRRTGESCGTDYQCSSLCCQSSTGTCSPHVINDVEQLLCNKPASQQCVTSEFCSRELTNTCYIVKTGFNAQNVPTCDLRCYNVYKFGRCDKGICLPALQPTPPTFDPANPDCSTAIDPSLIPGI